MAIVLLEGFDHWDNNFGTNNQASMKGWSSSGEGNHPGRLPYGPQSQSITAAIINNGIAKNLPSTYSSLTVGFGFLVSALADLTIFSFNSGVAGIGITGSGHMTLVNNVGAVVATGTSQIFPSQWHFVEAQFTSTTGILHLDGLSEIGSTSSTFGGSFSSVNFSYQRVGADSVWVDDMYVCDTSGGINTTFLGDICVETLYPISDGTYTQWTADIGGSHWPRVSEYIMNENVSYVHTTGAGNKDSYDIGNPTLANTTVYGVQLNLGAKKNDASVRTIDPLIRQAGADYLGTTRALTADYQFYSQIYNQDPTGSSWTYTNVNGDEYGIELVT